MRLPSDISDAGKGKETIHGAHEFSYHVSIMLAVKLAGLVDLHMRRNGWCRRSRGRRTFKLLNTASQVPHDGRAFIALVLHLLQRNLKLEECMMALLHCIGQLSAHPGRG